MVLNDFEIGLLLYALRHKETAISNYQNFGTKTDTFIVKIFLRHARDTAMLRFYRKNIIAKRSREATIPLKVVNGRREVPVTHSATHPSKVLGSLPIEDNRTTVVGVFVLSRSANLFGTGRRIENSCCFEDRV